MLYLIGSRHFRRLFPQNHEGHRNHAVSKTAGKVSRVNDPHQHLSSRERCQATEYADQNQRGNRGLVFLMKLPEKLRDHIGLRHGIHRTASTDQERVPARYNSAHSTDDQYLRHHRCLERRCHRIRCHQTGSAGGRGGDRAGIHDVADCKNNQSIERNGKYDREQKHLGDFFQRNIDLLRRLRDNVKTNEIEGAHHSHAQDIPRDSASGSHKHLTFQIGRASGNNRSHNQENSRTSNDNSEDRLQDGCCFRATDIDIGNKNRHRNRNRKPGCIYLETTDRIQITLQESGIYVGDDRRKRAGLEAYDTDVSENDRPAAYK